MKHYQEGKAYLYLITNEFGVHKVGIADCAFTRTSHIAQASGLPVSYVCVVSFPTKLAAFKVEQALLKTWEAYKTVGEWMRLSAQQVRDVVARMTLEGDDSEWQRMLEDKAYLEMYGIKYGTSHLFRKK